jgi:hypothetical protein
MLTFKEDFELVACDQINEVFKIENIIFWVSFVILPLQTASSGARSESRKVCAIKTLMI